MVGATNKAENISRAIEVTPSVCFIWVGVAQSLVFCVVFKEYCWSLRNLPIVLRLTSSVYLFDNCKLFVRFQDTSTRPDNSLVRVYVYTVSCFTIYISICFYNVLDGGVWAINLANFVLTRLCK